MDLDYTPETADGGAQTTIRIDAAERALLAEDVALPILVHRTMEAIIALRSGQRPAGRSTEAANWADMAGRADQLIRILEGVRDGAIRAHAAARGSERQLARALHVDYGVACARRDALLATEPSRWEPRPLTASAASED